MSYLSDLLALLNDILQAFIVIFGASVVLYNLPYLRRDRVLQAYSLLLGAVVLVFFTELLVSRVELIGSAEIWLRLKWLGIVCVPAIQFQFSDTLLLTTGSYSRRRRGLTALAYAGSLVFYTLVLTTPYIIKGIIELPNVSHFADGQFFFAFAIFFWTTSLASIYNVWRAYQRAITTSTRYRMRIILFGIMAAPLSAFPYLSLTPNTTKEVPIWAWLLLLVGNGIVGIMFSQLTANIIYVGGIESSRVMRVKLYKFMARVPMTASIVLLVYVLTIRASNFLGLATEAATAFTTITTLMLVEWAIHAYKSQLERILHFNNEPAIKHIQTLSNRLITRQDMRQFLESLLAAGCDRLRVPSAFIASLAGSKPELTAWIGAHDRFLPDASDDLSTLPTALHFEQITEELLIWNGYRIRPLYARDQESLVGILGIGLRDSSKIETKIELADDVQFSADEQTVVARIAEQAGHALEDQLLQYSVFAAVEGLLPTVTALQERRQVARHQGAVLLDEVISAESPIDNPDFNKMVKDALDHYWGGPKLTDSPLLDLQIVQSEAAAYEGNIVKGLRAILQKAIDLQKPDGEQSLSRTEWLLYNILELKVLQSTKVRAIANRLAMSEAAFYRKQRIAIKNVARAIAEMERSGDQLNSSTNK